MCQAKTSNKAQLGHSTTGPNLSKAGRNSVERNRRNVLRVVRVSDTSLWEALHAARPAGAAAEIHHAVHQPQRNPSFQTSTEPRTLPHLAVLQPTPVLQLAATCALEIQVIETFVWDCYWEFDNRYPLIHVAQALSWPLKSSQAPSKRAACMLGSS